MNNWIIKPIAAIAALLIINYSFCFAQDETDALRYSYTVPQGTARSMGIGSALGSIGGDFTSLSVNPAGIGIYRKGEIFITPGIQFKTTEGVYQSKSVTDNATRFSVNSFGAVFTRVPKGNDYKKSNWKAFSFGIGFNKMANFSRNYTYSGVNQGITSSSGSEVFAVDANSNFSNASTKGTPAYLGYQSYLLEFDSVNNFYSTNVPYEKGINQQRSVSERGGMSEIAFSFGGNYQERLMLGMAIGLPTVNYSRTADYTESLASGVSDNNFTSYTLSETLTTTGLGINAKLGFIYKAAEKFRIGAAFHSPSAIALSDIYDQAIGATTYAGKNTVVSPQNQFSYSMTTPWRGVLSATAIIGKVGFITADYEYVNYAAARMRFRTDDPLLTSSYAAYEREINQAVKNTYTAASNIRAGAEIRLNPLLLRAGVGYYGSPYKNYSNGNRLNISGGIGFRFDKAFLDLAYVHSNVKSQEQPYVLPTTGAYTNVVVPKATLSESGGNIAMTIGFKF